MNCFICSPYQGKESNIHLARRFMRYCAACGSAPIAPHVLLHGILDDFVPEQRAMGMKVGLDLMKVCTSLWVCGPTITEGMASEIKIARLRGLGLHQISLAELEAWEAQQ